MGGAALAPSRPPPALYAEVVPCLRFVWAVPSDDLAEGFDGSAHPKDPQYDLPSASDNGAPQRPVTTEMNVAA